CNGLEVVDEDRFVDLQFHIRATQSVFVRAVGNVVPCGEVLQMDPGQPGRSVAAGRCTAFLDLPGHVPDLVPGLGRDVLVKPRLLEYVLVVIEDRRGGVVGEGQHGAVGP